MPVIFNVCCDWSGNEGLAGAMIRASERTLEKAGLLLAEVSLTLVDDEEIRRLNREYRSVDKPTDVLSFPLMEPEEVEALKAGSAGGSGGSGGSGASRESGDILLGDVIVSWQRAREQAESFGHRLERELAFLAVHGTLHLMGYDHQTPEEEARMMAETEEILEGLGLGR